jgi:hypothetical protein
MLRWFLEARAPSVVLMMVPNAPPLGSSRDCFLDGDHIGSCESRIASRSIEEACSQTLVGGLE